MKILGKLVYALGVAGFFVGVVPALALFLAVGYLAGRLFDNKRTMPL
jgi:hypothetical protein